MDVPIPASTIISSKYNIKTQNRAFLNLFLINLIIHLKYTSLSFSMKSGKLAVDDMFSMFRDAARA